MNKLLALVLGLILLCPLATPIFAQSENAQIPEKTGDYPDPVHPGRRVRVFVHQVKPVRPTPTPPPFVEYCPNDDLNSLSAPGKTGWKLPSDWTYTLNTVSAPNRIGSVNFTTLANNAVSAWTQVVPVNITKTSLNTSVNRAVSDDQNIISWGRTQNSAIAVAYTWYYPDTGVVDETDIILNQKLPWFWQTNNMCTDANAYDVQDILTHELGHWIGLNDAYDGEFANNTMYGYGSKGETKKDTLTTGDIQGVKAVYQ